MISRNGVPVVGFGLGFGKPGDWYYTRVIYPDDVRAAKRRVDAKFLSVDRDVKMCPAFTDNERSAWTALFNSWRKLYCLSDKADCTDPDASYLGLGGQMDDVERYEKSAYDWQLRLQSKACTPSANIEKPDIVKREESERRTDVIDAVKVIAVAVAGAVGVIYVVPQIAKLIPERSK